MTKDGGDRRAERTLLRCNANVGVGKCAPAIPTDSWASPPLPGLRQTEAGTMGEPKPRKRIVAQLIVSPTHEREGAIAAVPEEAPQAVQLDQKEQAEWAREHLGPDRKVFVDLTAAANKEVDWKQVRARAGGCGQCYCQRRCAAACRCRHQHRVATKL